MIAVPAIPVDEPQTYSAKHCSMLLSQRPKEPKALMPVSSQLGISNPAEDLEEDYLATKRQGIWLSKIRDNHGWMLYHMSPLTHTPPISNSNKITSSPT